MTGYKIAWTKRATKDLLLLRQKPALIKKLNELISVIKKNPYQYYSPFEELGGDLEGKFSARINIQHRLIYEVDEELKTVKLLRAWSHYE